MLFVRIEVVFFFDSRGQHGEEEKDMFVNFGSLSFFFLLHIILNFVLFFFFMRR